jgi:hypothetical protein
MTKTTKTLLAGALASLSLGLLPVVGWVRAQDLTGLYVIFPVGAVLFGLFLIAKMLERESALYDADHEGSQTNSPPGGSA